MLSEWVDVGAPSSLESLFRLWYDKDPEAQKAEGPYAVEWPSQPSEWHSAVEKGREFAALCQV